MTKNLEYYVTLPWTYRFDWSDVGCCYIATIKELEGCVADGKTFEEAITMINDALRSYVNSCLKNNEEIPEPLKLSDYKGTITYRTSPEKHYKIAKSAASQGKSINKLIDDTLDDYFVSMGVL